MALEILANWGDPSRHEYHHDLESFGWILLWCAFELNFNGEVVGFEGRYPVLREWTDAADWPTLKSKKLYFVMQGLEAHRSKVTKAMRPLRKRWISHVFYRMGKTLVSKNRVIDGSDSDDEDTDDTDLVPDIALGKIKSVPLTRDEPDSESFFIFENFLDCLVPRERGHHVENLRLHSP